MNISQTDEFKKDFKYLSKKYRTLEKDFEILIRAIDAEPKGDGTKHWNLLINIKEIYFFKVRMMCRSVRGADFRVIYMYDGKKLELLFIEIYYKGDKVNNDKNRIDKILKNIIK
jgi:mRNA-degrading endonuclease RelE of RelBE toxin-antitoxin system